MSKFDGALCSAPALLSVRLAQGCPSLDDELVAVGCASFSAGTSFSAIRAWMMSIDCGSRGRFFQRWHFFQCHPSEPG